MEFKLGWRRPLSQNEMKFEDIPVFSPSFSCERPSCFRRSLRILPKAISILGVFLGTHYSINSLRI